MNWSKSNINTDGLNEQAVLEAVLSYIKTNPCFTNLWAQM